MKHLYILKQTFNLLALFSLRIKIVITTKWYLAIFSNLQGIIGADKKKTMLLKRMTKIEIMM